MNPTTESRWLDDGEQAAWRAYLRGSRLLEVELDRALDTYGVSLTEYELLSMLSESPGQRTRMSLLADQIVQSRSRVSHTAARLERRGWVVREPAPDDRRGVVIALAPAGRTALDAMSPTHVESVRAALVDILTPQQFAALGEAMAWVRDHLCPGQREPGEA